MGLFRRSSAQSVAVLTALLEEPRTWRHGYALSKATGLQSGTLYPILSRLEERGCLEAKWLEPTHPGRPPRRVCRLTPTGLAFARETVGARKYATQLLRQERVKV